MHEDLLRRALESGKTVSKKAKSRQPSAKVSAQASPVASRTASRVASRNVSDDESEFSDTTSFGTGSIDDILATEEADGVGDAWIQILNDHITKITDRKRSSAEGREDTLNGFSHVLMAHYAKQELRGRIGELLPAILKSVRAGQTERETVLALKALALLLITVPTDDIYDAIVQPVKLVITDSQHISAKVAAIHVLGVATFYGGASLDETEENMSFFVEIVESDGQSIDAADSGDVVAAVLEEWGFLATQLEDMSESSEEVMEALVEQLDSSDVSVQIASGENIALLFEKSYTELEEDEEPEEQDSDSDEDDDSGPPMVKRYTVYRREDQLKHQLESLSSASSKRMSKKDRKSLHTNFADILNTVERPTRGPRYSTAINDETGRAYGSRMTVGIGGKAHLKIRSWEQLHRLRALRRVLQGGFLVHYSDNEVVFDTLPLMLQG